MANLDTQAVQLQAGNRNMRGISGSTLKLLAIFSMLVDHTAAVIITNPAFHENNPMLLHTGESMRLFGRIAFPIFCFLLVEGWVHTRNKKKYALRLAAFALLSEVPFDLALTGRVYNPSSQNVFFTLLIGLLVLAGFEAVTARFKSPARFPLRVSVGLVVCTLLTVFYLVSIALPIIHFIGKEAGRQADIELTQPAAVALFMATAAGWLIAYLKLCRQHPYLQVNAAFSQPIVLLAGLIAASLLRTDYGDLGVLVIALMYLLRKHPPKAMLAGCAALTVLTLNQLWALVNVFFIYAYNGKRGLSLKYMFYLFYPLHLLVLYAIASYLKIG